MSLKQDIDRFLAELDAAIDSAMEFEVAEISKNYIADAVETEVYEKYDPVVYKRRRDTDGGLQDKNAMIAEYDVATKTLTVESQGIDQSTGVIAAHIVEETYNYEYPPRRDIGLRPFHSIAEENLIKSGDAERALAEGLKRMGFDVE